MIVIGKKERNNMTMKERIKGYMETFGSITTAQAFFDLGCTRLSEYIRQLRLDYDIDDEWVKSVNRYEKVEFKKYFFRETK